MLNQISNAKSNLECEIKSRMTNSISTPTFVECIWHLRRIPFTNFDASNPTAFDTCRELQGQQNTRRLLSGFWGYSGFEYAVIHSLICSLLIDITLLLTDITLLLNDITLLLIDITLLLIDITLLLNDITLLLIDITLLLIDITLLLIDITLLLIDITLLLIDITLLLIDVELLTDFDRMRVSIQDFDSRFRFKISIRVWIRVNHFFLIDFSNG